MFDPSFRRCLEEAVGAEAAQRALQALSEEASVSVRLNPYKLKDLPFEEAAGVAWSPWGYVLPSRPQFTLDPLFHAGAYYVQDSSAMFAGYVFRRIMQLKDRPLRVLDLCAAPGGKTTDLAASLRESCGDRFVLVANEVVRQRAEALRDNVSLWGDPNVVVSSADPRAFAALEGFFDVILADVPCSGEGMFRKDPKAAADWSVETVRLCAARQRRIIADVWPALSRNGQLIYATCTFNRQENDGNVQWIVSELGAELIPVEDPPAGVMRTGTGFCLIPGQVRGEGQFVAALRKTGGAESYRVKASPKRRNRDLERIFDREMIVSKQGDAVVAAPEAAAAEIEALRPLRILSGGVAAGTLKGGTLVPEADLALSLSLNAQYFHSIEIDRETALQYLHRDTLVLHGEPKGFILLKYKGIPLGFVKNLGTRCNNLHPPRRRIRMAISPSHAARRS